MDGGGSKGEELYYPPRTPHPSLGHTHQGGGGAWLVLGVFLVEVTRWALGFFWGGGRGGGAPAGAAAPLPPPAVTCSQFPCHPAVTFHLLATEQKHSAGTLQKGGGSDCQCFD